VPKLKYLHLKYFKKTYFFECFKKLEFDKYTVLEEFVVDLSELKVEIDVNAVFKMIRPFAKKFRSLKFISKTIKVPLSNSTFEVEQDKSMRMSIHRDGSSDF